MMPIRGDVAQVEARLRERDYPVAGRTVADLRRAMAWLGPRGEGSRLRHPAYTDWHVRWRWTPARDEGGYRARVEEIAVDIEVTLPRWRPPSSAEPEAIAWFDRLLAELREHENGHVRIAIDAAEDVRAAIAASRAATEDALGAAVEERVAVVLDAHHARERTYDAE